MLTGRTRTANLSINGRPTLPPEPLVLIRTLYLLLVFPLILSRVSVFSITPRSLLKHNRTRICRLVLPLLTGIRPLRTVWMMLGDMILWGKTLFFLSRPEDTQQTEAAEGLCVLHIGELVWKSVLRGIHPSPTYSFREFNTRLAAHHEERREVKYNQ